MTGLAIGETSDKPIAFKIKSRNAVNSSGMEEWVASEAQGQVKDVQVAGEMAITAIEVCTNGPSSDTDKHRVKGVTLFGRTLNKQTGKTEGAESSSKFELPNCPANGWRGKKSCPTGQIAVGFDVQKGDVGVFTGIGLVCSSFGPHDARRRRSKGWRHAEGVRDLHRAASQGPLLAAGAACLWLRWCELPRSLHGMGLGHERGLGGHLQEIGSAMKASGAGRP